MKKKQLIGSLFLLATLVLVGCAKKQTAAPETPTVSVSVPIEKTLTEYLIFTGRTDAVHTVEVASHVRGYLTAVKFKDGKMVKKNQVLYEIDKRPFQAKLVEAQGNLEKAMGQKQLAEIQVKRYTSLAKKGAASQEDLDEWKARLVEAKGSVKSAQGQITDAKLNVEFCTIRAAMDGEIGRALVDVGDLVTPDVSTLATIVTLDPIYGYFNVDDPAFQRVVKQVRSGVIPLDEAGQMDVDMSLSDATADFPLHGKLDFVNNQVDKLTASITVRAKFDNPFDFEKGLPPLMKPGMFARLRVPTGQPGPRLLVNQRAIGTDQAYRFVYIVDDQDTVQYRRVELGQQQKDGLQIIKSGLKAGERVVVNGLQRCRPRMTVQTEKVDMITLKPVKEAQAQDSKP